MATALSGAEGSRRPTSPNFGMAGENVAWSSSVSGVWTTYAPAEWFAFTGFLAESPGVHAGDECISRLL